MQTVANERRRTLDLGQLDQAVRSTTEATDILQGMSRSRAAPDGAQLADALTNLSIMHREGGSIDEAISVSRRLVTVLRNRDPQDGPANLRLAEALVWLGELLHEEGLHFSAAQVVDESLALYQEGDPTQSVEAAAALRSKIAAELDP